jgi:hypothetical protein
MTGFNFPRFVAPASTALLVVGALAAPLAKAQEFHYPPEGRTEVQQRQDRFECHEWSVAQSKFDPVEVAAAMIEAATRANPQTDDARSGESSTGRSAIGGAAAGALVGELVSDDAGKGAIAGGAAGLMRGRMADRKAASEQAGAEQRAQEQQARQTQNLRAGQQAYERARSTCFKARGYITSGGQ